MPTFEDVHTTAGKADPLSQRLELAQRLLQHWGLLLKLLPAASGQGQKISNQVRTENQHQRDKKEQQINSKEKQNKKNNRKSASR